jgi:3-phenylpropionate/trans-cinnamate dioxygenase ferredoxin reductase subunit
MLRSVIIIGASHAAAQTCVSLRQGGWDGAITIIGDETVLPYQRPPLSKDFLSGHKTIDDILIRPASTYDTANIEMRLGIRVENIDRKNKTVLMKDGSELSYDKLVLTTGARVRRLPIKGEGSDNVFYLRDTSDVLSIKKKAEKAKTAVIIGGGYIGLEVAASLRQQGLEVTVLEAMPRILQRVTAPELSRFYKRVHHEEGVCIEEGVLASEIKQQGKKLNVMTSCDQSYSADMVIIGIGVIPNVELADSAGLKIGNGIQVNEYCQTSDPDIYAAGDVTWHHNPIYDQMVRLESVPNATEQGKVVASHINGLLKPHNSLPWFWSDQFDLKLQIAGLSTGYDDLVIRGDIENSRSFAAYYFKGEKFIAVDAVNAPRDFKLSLSKRVSLDIMKLADSENGLKDCVK